MGNFVIQRLIKTHKISAAGRLGTWRTVTLLTSEAEALRQLQRMSQRAMVRALSSPCEREMVMHAEVKEWTV
jgi:hypothetical protein